MNIYLIASEDHKVFGVGQTTRTYEERHHDGDWAKFHNYLKARGEELVLIHWWEDVDIDDHEIHAWLRNQPGIRKYAEWFSHKTTLDIVEDMIQRQFFTDYEDNKTHLELYHFQREFVEKAHTPYDQFLLAAKCRAGKSAMVLSHILDRGFRVSLVVSLCKSPSQSWLQDVKQFSNFDNMVTVNLSDTDWIEQVRYWTQSDKQVILWSTVQGLQKRLDALLAITPVGLLVFDEAHIGDKAKMFSKVRDQLSLTPCLKVSGTAYNQLWDVSEHNRYVYDYFQEQRDVKLGLVDRPKMHVILAKYESDGYTTVYGDDPDAMRNLFLVEGGQFVNPQLVKEFINKYFELDKFVKPQDRLLHDSNHIYLTLPSVQACHLFAELLPAEWPAKVVTGDTHSDSDSINQFVNEHNKSVCLTVSANVLGMTQKLWDTVINCREGKSIQFWTQFAFRGGSSDHDWRVIDFVPTRALESLRETFVLANDLDSTLSEYDFTDFVPIHEWDNGFTTLSDDDVNNILAHDIGTTVRLMTGGTEGIDVDKLVDFDFNNFVKFDSEVTKAVVLNEENNNNDCAKQRINERNKGERTQLQQKIATVKAYLALIPEVMFEERLQGHNHTTIHDVIQSQTYNIVTGDNGLLSELLDDRVLSSKTLTRRVSGVARTLSVSPLNSSTLKGIMTTTGTQQGIPNELLDTMS